MLLSWCATPELTGQIGVHIFHVSSLFGNCFSLQIQLTPLRYIFVEHLTMILRMHSLMGRPISKKWHFECQTATIELRTNDCTHGHRCSRSMQIPNLSLPPLVQNSPDFNVLAAAVIDWRTLSAGHFSMPQHRKILPAWEGDWDAEAILSMCLWQLNLPTQAIHTNNTTQRLYIHTSTYIPFWHISSWRSETGAQVKRHNMDKNRSNEDNSKDSNILRAIFANQVL